MFCRSMVTGLLAALLTYPTSATYAADDAVPQTNTMDDKEDILRELNDLRRLSIDLQHRINALESTLVRSRRDHASMPPVALDGCCPVELVENDRWVRGSASVSVVHRGQSYLFKDAAARSAFLTFPDRYCPVFNGSDAIAWIDNGEHIPGRREHGVTYDGRIYLFASEENLDKFFAAPKHYAKIVASAPPIPESLSEQPNSQEHDSADQQRKSEWPTHSVEATSGNKRTGYCPASRARKRVGHRRTRW